MEMNIHLLKVLLMVNPRGPMVKNPSPCGPWAYEILQLYETWPPDLNNCWGQIFLGQINSSQNSIKFYEGKSYRIFQCLELSDHGENCNTSQIHRCPWTQLRSFLLFCMPPGIGIRSKKPLCLRCCKCLRPKSSPQEFVEPLECSGPCQAMGRTSLKNWEIPRTFRRRVNEWNWGHGRHPDHPKKNKAS